MQITVTSQSAERVEIVAGTYATPVDAPEACAALGKSPGPIAVDLLAPLGNRQAVDGTDQKVMTVLNPAEYPAPTYLPNGYKSAGTTVDAPGIVGEGDRITRTYWNGQKRIEIAWRSGMFALSAVSEVITRTSVNGATATVWKDKGFDDARLITWSAQPGLYITIQSNANEHQTLSTDELVSIARSLPAA